MTSPLTVVMPVYNEERALPAVLHDVCCLVLDLVPGSELLVVDDCSTDDSPQVLASAAAADPRIRVMRNTANSGHGRSVRNGLDAAQGEWLLQIDSDGQVDLERFAQFWAVRERADLVMGVRVERNDGRHRAVISACTRVVASVLARRRLRDANVPFKMVRAHFYRHIAPFIPIDAFAPSILLVVGAARTGARIEEVAVRHLPREHGTSTIRVMRLARAVVRSAAQTIAFGVRRLPRYGDG